MNYPNGEIPKWYEIEGGCLGYIGKDLITHKDIYQEFETSDEYLKWWQEEGEDKE